MVLNFLDCLLVSQILLSSGYCCQKSFVAGRTHETYQVIIENAGIKQAVNILGRMRIGLRVTVT